MPGIHALSLFPLHVKLINVWLFALIFSRSLPLSAVTLAPSVLFLISYVLRSATRNGACGAGATLAGWPAGEKIRNSVRSASRCKSVATSLFGLQTAWRQISQSEFKVCQLSDHVRMWFLEIGFKTNTLQMIYLSSEYVSFCMNNTSCGFIVPMGEVWLLIFTFYCFLLL